MGKTWPALDIRLRGRDSDLQDLLLAELDDFHPTAIQEPDDGPAMRAFFTSSTDRDDARRVLQESFGTHVFLETIDVEDDNWAVRSQENLRAVVVGELTIAPPWDTSSGRSTIVIQPSMGFGTGHHATTRLMLKALQQLDVRGRTVLDVGCGSGVLAIAAATLGANHATAMDHDPDALESARENVHLNSVTSTVELQEGDLRALTEPADIVLANLTGALLQNSVNTLARLVQPCGFLVVSGFMNSETSVVPALERRFTLVRIEGEDEWLCATLSAAERT